LATLFTRLVVQPTLQGVEAVKALLEATPETPSYMIGIRENTITRVPLMEAVEMVRTRKKKLTSKGLHKLYYIYRQGQFRMQSVKTTLKWRCHFEIPSFASVWKGSLRQLIWKKKNCYRKARRVIQVLDYLINSLISVLQRMRVAIMQ
jgi:hypothetical protein